VINEDLFKVPPHRIGKARVQLTMLAGRVVYRDSTAP
jgi:predicted amidohydrolase YtcJ